MHTFRYKYNNVLIYINLYMFWASVAHQGVHSCIKQSFDLIIISRMWNCRQFINLSFLEMDICTENYKTLNIRIVITKYFIIFIV